MSNMVQESKNVVRVAVGAGNEPILVEWQEGDTVASVLKRTNVELKEWQVATIGKRRIKDMTSTKVKPGTIIVIAGKPGNGSRNVGSVATITLG